MTDSISQILAGSLQGTSLSSAEKNFLETNLPCGLTLFSRNIENNNLAQLKDLVKSVQDLYPASDPALMMIDQEGGRVRRIKNNFPEFGPALSLAGGQTDPASLAKIRQYALEIGHALENLGIHINFAPVLDILTNPENIAIGDRCFGTTPEQVKDRALEFLKGLQESAVMGCLKHFPGQGDAAGDTHEKSVRVPLSEDELLNREILPFSHCIGEASLVMISHCVYQGIDPEKPASLSKKVMEDLLRGRLGYTGVIVTDDMMMGAIPQEKEEWAESIAEAIVGGADLALVCRGLEEWIYAIEFLRKLRGSSPAFAKRVENAANRVAKLRKKIGARLGRASIPMSRESSSALENSL